MSPPHPIIAELLKRNEHWRRAITAAKPDLLQRNAAGQQPKLLWLGCSDSRVPESVITEAEPGQIFVTRNTGAQFNPQDDNVVSTLTFGVQMLGVEDILVVGHTQCGSMTAAAEAAANGTKHEGAFGRYLAPLITLAKTLRQKDGMEKLSHSDFVNALAEESVKMDIRNIAASPVISDNWAGVPSPLSGEVMNKVRIHGLMYEVETGKLKDLGVSVHPSSGPSP